VSQLTLNHPLGSDIMNAMLYLADIEVVRWFDMNAGAPKGSVTVKGMTGFINDIEAMPDGAIYGTQPGSDDPASWCVYKVTPQRGSSVFVGGPPLNRPNGIAFDPKGNIVVVNSGGLPGVPASGCWRSMNSERPVTVEEWIDGSGRCRHTRGARRAPAV
jgi:hypothetical protein